MSVNELIKKRRKELNITLEEIGDYVGVSKATVQRWETGGISNMRQDRIKKLSEILRLEPTAFIGGNSGETSAFVKIPVLGRVAAGVPITAQEDVIGYEKVPAEWVQNSTLFALKLKGDSMEPRMANGDVVIVRKQDNIESGEVAIVMVDNQEATCKKVVKHSDGLVLISNNPKYAPVFFTIDEIEHRPVKILGRVIELRARF
ncbi:MAG: helix-turn-helix domain-containing protein [Oscillospiraceae bacterium]|nr:helix-turn-helix domain-containing protein [Oscillospiraceae bacterium]